MGECPGPGRGNGGRGARGRDALALRGAAGGWIPWPWVDEWGDRGNALALRGAAG